MVLKSLLAQIIHFDFIKIGLQNKNKKGFITKLSSFKLV
jgi:hypothetical protein